MKIPRLLILLTLAALLLASCRPAQPTGAPPEETAPVASEEPTSPPTLDLTQLYNVEWALSAYGDPISPTVVPVGLKISANFSPEGTVGGSAGCNIYNTAYTAQSDGSLNINEQIMTTMMACPEEEMKAETAYLAALPKAHSFSFTPEGNLVIQYAAEGGKPGALVYIKGAVPLVGQQWSLVSFGNPTSPTQVLPGTAITALFGEDGKVNGSAGCNGYFGDYQVEGDKLTIGALASSMMFCENSMEQETAYLAALQAAQTFEIKGQNLVITYSEGQLNFTSAALPLENTLWSLVAVDGVPAPQEIVISAVFKLGSDASAGTVSGKSACNNYFADYTKNENTIDIAAPATTFMACPDDIMKAEQGYLLKLQGAHEVEILGGVLTLRSETGILTFNAERTPLLGALWQLVALGDVDQPVAPVAGANFTAQFSRNTGAPSGVLSGTTGCNEYAAAFAASTTEIKINTPAASANQTCAPGLTSQEELYFLALSDATTYNILGDQLIMPYDGGKQALVFQGTQLEFAERPPLSALDGSLWYLWMMNDQPILPGTTITASFAVPPEGLSGQINGSAGCNTYLAEFGKDLGVQAYQTSGGSCASPAGVMEQEQAYIAAIGRAFGYWQTGDQLIINTGLGALTYRSQRIVSSNDQTHLLVGPRWFLISWSANFSVAGTQEPFTQFNPDGRLNGFTGCNTINGQWTTSATQAGNQITISNLSSTKAACTDQALQQQETNMMAILGSANRYQVINTSMQISGASGVLNYSLTPRSRPEEVTPPTAVISGPTTAQVNQVVTFNANSSTGGLPITQWAWEFGDGARGSGPVVQHVYRDPGGFRVQLTVWDQAGRYESTAMTITIQPKPVQPTPTAAPPTQVPPTQAPPTEQPKPTEQPTQAPQPTQGPQPTEAPTAAPPPTEAPTPIPPPTEQPTEVPVPTQLPEIPPNAVLSSPTSGYVGEPVAFSAASSTPGSTPIQSFAWDFGDGVTLPPGSQNQVTHLYNRSGVYQVTVIITDQGGLSSSATSQVRVDARLDTTVWTLSNSSNFTLPPGSVITLQFLTGQIAGFAGCNSYTGSFTASDNGDGTFAVAPTGITTSRMVCPQGVMDLENEYLSNLGQVNLAQVQGNILVLNFPSGSMTFVEVGTTR